MDLEQRLAALDAARRRDTAERLMMREALLSLFQAHPDGRALRDRFKKNAEDLMADALSSPIGDKDIEAMRNLYQELLLVVPIA